jgi:putative inorganic carbon (hco3(-)) transporter
MNFKHFFDKAIFTSFALLLFLVPLVLTPVNYELFEYNKMMLAYSLTAVIIGFWLGKIIVSKHINLKKTPLDIFILLFLISSVLSTAFSIHPYTSIWGYYSRFHGGLLSTVAYIALYYAFVSNLDKDKTLKLLYIALGSAFLVAFYGILERFGIDAQYWIQDVQNRVFSTLGQPNWLGAYLSALIFIPLALAFWFKNTARGYLSYVLYLVFFFCLIFTNSKSAILAFFAGFLLFTVLLLIQNKKQRVETKNNFSLKSLGIVWLITILIYLFLGQNTYSYINKAPQWLNIFTKKTVTVPTPQPMVNNELKPFISESSDIRKIVWQGAFRIWKAYPLFGSGLSTFGYAYYNYRPTEHNLVSEWDYLYNKAHNEFLDILATQGTLGIITYFVFILSFIVCYFHYLLNLKKNQPQLTDFLITALFSGFITILITNFFGFSVVIIGILFFLIPGFSLVFQNQLQQISLNLEKKDKKTKALAKLDITQKLGLIIVFMIIGFLQLGLINIWRADFHFNKGESYSQSAYLISALPELQNAIELNPRPALYHSELAETSAKLAYAYWDTDATDSADIINQLKELALNEAQLSRLLNPVHLNLYKSQAKTYIYLSYIDPEYTKLAIETLNQASILAPTDAKVYYNLGIMYHQENNLSQAISAWEKAAELKPDYLAVYLKLAEAYINTGQLNKAEPVLVHIVKNIAPQDTRALKLLKEIKEQEQI